MLYEEDGFTRRTPCGVRGLKLFMFGMGGGGWGSHPVRGAWIEISYEKITFEELYVAPRAGCVD